MRKPLPKSQSLVIHQPTMVEVHELNPSVYNPNVQSLEVYEALKHSIRVDGFVQSVVVQKEGTRIIGGHHSVRAIREICIEDGMQIPKIPVVLLDVDDVRAKRLNLKLNNLKGNPNPQLLGELLVDIYKDPDATMIDAAFVEDDAALLGLANDDVFKFVRLIDAALVPEPEIAIDEPVSFGRAATLSLEFSDAETRDKVKSLLVERAETEKKKTGDVIAGVLLGKSKTKKRAA